MAHNVFDRVVAKDYEGLTSLGRPLRDPGAIERRLNLFWTLTGGRGFRQPKMKYPNPHRRARRHVHRLIYERALLAEQEVRLKLAEQEARLK